MKSIIDNYKIAFVGWNPFQLLHVKNLLLSMPNSVFIIEKRRDSNVQFFSDNLLDDIKSQIVILEQKNMISLDEGYDIIITQTLFRDIHKIKKAKIVMLQYGYAKEPHNYGTWRAFASLCLTYGEYASQKIAPLSPTVATGNPRYDLWHDSSFQQKAKERYQNYINPNKKTILYMPTWGELSSFDLYIDAIVALGDSYNILIKLHHNTDYLELSKVSKIKSKNLNYFGANDDSLELISLANIVISDYSGAIFDAIYCRKSVVLLDLPKERLLKSKKIDAYSLEFTNRDSLGVRVASANELASTVKNLKAKESVLTNRLFVQTDNAVENIHTALIDLMEGRYQRSQTQQYIYQSMVELHSKKSLRERFRRVAIDVYLTILSWRRRDAK